MFRVKIVESIKKIFPGDHRALLRHTATAALVPFILASASPTKQKIMELLGIAFECDPADIDESEIKAATPEQLVEKIAKVKAEVVKERCLRSFIVAADTLIFHEGKPIGKPKDEQSAHEILRILSGSGHQAMTGLALYDPITTQIATHVEVSTVRFHPLTEEMIAEYVQTGEPMGRAGAYALQGKGGSLVDSLHGDRTNVYGLPVKAMLNLVSSLGYEWTPAV